ncbi:MAG: hypothetical protein JWP81_3660 [Ferruginibacter sp.]|nr:hypothetical protein [Ferruginibacter sp.]
MKKKTLLFVSIVAFFTCTLKAQETSTTPEYKTAVGIRLGPSSPAIAPGFTVKHFLDDQHAVEGILGINDGIGLCALYEWHKPIVSVEHLQWFVGAGGYAAYRSKTSYVGAAGIVGVDYKFQDIPLNISVDWKPELNIITSVGFEASGVGFSARFTF